MPQVVQHARPVLVVLSYLLQKSQKSAARQDDIFTVNVRPPPTAGPHWFNDLPIPLRCLGSTAALPPPNKWMTLPHPSQQVHDPAPPLPTSACPCPPLPNQWMTLPRPNLYTAQPDPSSPVQSPAHHGKQCPLYSLPAEPQPTAHRTSCLISQTEQTVGELPVTLQLFWSTWK